MQALADPQGSAFKVSKGGLERPLAWSEPGLQEPSPAITAMNFVVEANQDRDELSICENELPLMVGVAGHDLNVLEGEARCQTAAQRRSQTELTHCDAQGFSAPLATRSPAPFSGDLNRRHDQREDTGSRTRQPASDPP